MAAVDRDDPVLNPDLWAPGLNFDAGSLSRKKVSRAKDAEDVLRVALQHNLRVDNERHRHRKPIDSARTSLNSVLIGAATPDGVVDEARAILARCRLEWPEDRRNRVVALEMVFQPPPGADAPAFWVEVVTWLERRFDHVVSLVIHRDQVRVHAHAVVLAVMNNAWAGREMGRNQFGRPKLRHSFLSHIRDSTGLRADRPGRTLADIAASRGSGPQTPAAAARRDAAFLAKTTPVGDWRGGPLSIPITRVTIEDQCPELRMSAASAPEPATSLNPGAVGQVSAQHVTAVADVPRGAAGAAGVEPAAGAVQMREVGSVGGEQVPAQVAGAAVAVEPAGTAVHSVMPADSVAADARRAAAILRAREAVQEALLLGADLGDMVPAAAGIDDAGARAVLHRAVQGAGLGDAITAATRSRPRSVVAALHLIGVRPLH